MLQCSTPCHQLQKREAPGTLVTIDILSLIFLKLAGRIYYASRASLKNLFQMS